jgi:hypothetical protein
VRAITPSIYKVVPLSELRVPEMIGVINEEFNSKRIK